MDDDGFDSGMAPKKSVSPDGRTTVRFTNGDIKQTFPPSPHEASNGGSAKACRLVVYYYASAQTTHTTFDDGKEIFEFPNQQVIFIYCSILKSIIRARHSCYPSIHCLLSPDRTLLPSFTLRITPNVLIPFHCSCYTPVW